MDKQDARRAEIETAAFEVLAEVGYKKASVLQIAKRARASNETLYAWYGNKQALFSALIEANGQSVRDTLEAVLSDKDDHATSLRDIGSMLLQFTATEKAVIVNRAAVADATETGLLAQAIDQSARRVMYQLLTDLMGRLEGSGRYSFDQGPEIAVDVFIGLLLGELQMQQALGAAEPLSPKEIEVRSERASDLFDRLYLAFR